MHAMGIDAAGVAIHHPESGKDFGLCNSHAQTWDSDATVFVGPIFSDDFTCIVCANAAGR